MSASWIIILVFLAFLLFGTSGPAATGGHVVESATVEARRVSIPVEVDGNPGVILDAETYWGDHENWTPTVEDLQAAEDAVRAAAPLDGRDPVLDGYRQYVGIIEDGVRKIVVNSFCQHFDGWEENFIQVDDGGPCFWAATYNVETGELDSFVVNGLA